MKRSVIRSAKTLFLLILLALALFAPQRGRADSKNVTEADAVEPIEIKMAAIAPQGSGWADCGYEAAERIFENTKGRIKVTWYLGGVMGDEPDMVKRMRIGQLHGSVLTLIGLGQIIPEIRVLQLPLLFHSPEEVDHVLPRLKPTFQRLIEKKRYVLLDWCEAGFARLFSSRPFAGLDDLPKLTPWIWTGERIGEAMLTALNMTRGIPLPFAEVLVALQTGTVDTFGGSFYSTVALQWHPHAKFALDPAMAYTPGGIVMNKRFYEEIPEDLRQHFYACINEFAPKLRDLIRSSEEVARRGLLERGMKLVRFTPEEQRDLEKRCLTIHDQLADQEYPRWLLEEVRAAIQEVRGRAGQSEGEADGLSAR